MFLRLRGETQLVNRVNDVPQIIPTLNPVLNFPENLADLVFDGIRPGGFLLEAMQVGKKPGVDELDEVVASEGGVVVDLATFFRRGPF